MNMFMAVKDDQPMPPMEKPEIYGRKKSDITAHGDLYQRSYH